MPGSPIGVPHVGIPYCGAVMPEMPFIGMLQGEPPETPIGNGAIGGIPVSDLLLLAFLGLGFFIQRHMPLGLLALLLGWSMSVSAGNPTPSLTISR